VHGWQYFGTAAICAATGVCLIRPWVNGRLASFSVLIKLGCAVLLAGIGLAGSLWYRVAEISGVEEPPQFQRFLERLPAPEENEAGQLARSARSQVADLVRQARDQKARRDPFQKGQPDDELNYLSLAEKVVHRGWPAEGEELGLWLDQVFAQRWPNLLKQLVDKPGGVMDDPRRQSMAEAAKIINPTREIGFLLAARGLQLQAEGDPAAMVQHLAAGLAYARVLQDRGDIFDTTIAWEMERTLLQGLDRWLEKLHGRADLLRKIQKVLADHLHKTKSDFSDIHKVEYLHARNSLEDPKEWAIFISIPDDREERSTVWKGTNELLAQLVWLTPWERARQNRILRSVFWGDQTDIGKALDVSPGTFFMGIRANRFMDRLGPQIQYREARFKAAELTVALRRYQADNGNLPKTLAALVPGYLPAVPSDPYDRRPFRYRISKGERMPLNDFARRIWGVGDLPGEFIDIPIGQGILWCVGDDLGDDGGLMPAHGPTHCERGQDYIFLVPLAPKK
jgi:hypothetical protein